MDVKLESMIDSLTTLIRAIAEDVKLKNWFVGLERKTNVERRNAIYAMSQRMAAFHEDPGLINSLKLLSVPKVFEAARHSVHRVRR